MTESSSSTGSSLAIPRSTLLIAFGVAVVLSLGLGFIPRGGTIIYPFRLYATFAHEMGHGVGALITGNSFLELELYRSLGGVAFTRGADGFSQVVVSSLGLIGPAVVGAIVMVAGSRPRTAPFVLSALAGLTALSTLIWVRNAFGFFSMLAISALLVVAAKFGNAVFRVGLAQLIAVQLGLASWSNREYLFTQGFSRDGRRLDSDTQQIANEWILPYWFWGALLGGLSIIVLLWAFWYVWIKPALVRSS